MFKLKLVFLAENQIILFRNYHRVFARKHKPNALKSRIYHTKCQIWNLEYWLRGKRKNVFATEISLRCFWQTDMFHIYNPLSFSSSCYTDVYSKVRKNIPVAQHMWAMSCTQETFHISHTKACKQLLHACAELTWLSAFTRIQWSSANSLSCKYAICITFKNNALLSKKKSN